MGRLVNSSFGLYVPFAEIFLPPCFVFCNPLYVSLIAIAFNSMSSQNWKILIGRSKHLGVVAPFFGAIHLSGINPYELWSQGLANTVQEVDWFLQILSAQIINTIIINQDALAMQRGNAQPQMELVCISSRFCHGFRFHLLCFWACGRLDSSLLGLMWVM